MVTTVITHVPLIENRETLSNSYYSWKNGSEQRCKTLSEITPGRVVRTPEGPRWDPQANCSVARFDEIGAKQCLAGKRIGCIGDETVLGGVTKVIAGRAGLDLYPTTSSNAVYNKSGVKGGVEFYNSPSGYFDTLVELREVVKGLDVVVLYQNAEDYILHCLGVFGYFQEQKRRMVMLKKAMRKDTTLLLYDIAVSEESPNAVFRKARLLAAGCANVAVYTAVGPISGHNRDLDTALTDPLLNTICSHGDDSPLQAIVPPCEEEVMEEWVQVCS